MSSSFSPDELSEILARAHEIEAQRGESLLQLPEVAEILDAAEEAGLNREATMQALRERLYEQRTEWAPNDLVFAASDDGHSYPAIVTDLPGKAVEVRFMNGTKVRLEASAVTPFSLTPGRKLQFLNQTFGMWTDGEVVRYNEDGRSVTLSLWGKDNTVSLEHVRVKKPSPILAIQTSLKQKVAIWLVTTAAASGLIGFLIGFLASR